MWQVNSHNPACGPCPPQPWRRVVHTFTGAPTGKSREAAHVMSESTPLDILLLFFPEIITLLVVETNRYYHQFLENPDDGSGTWGDRSRNVCVCGSDITDGTQFKADWRTTGRKWNSFTLHSMDKRWHMLGTITYCAFYISQTIIGMELTEQVTDCGKYEAYLKL